MQKTIEYKMNRVIDFIQLTDELFAYSDKHYRNDSLISETEGIATKKILDGISSDEKIEQYHTEVRLGVKSEINLFHNEIKESVRQFIFGSDKGIEEFDKQMIEKPYSYVSEFGMNDDVCLMFLSYHDHNVYDVNFNVQPKAVHFDYIQAQMNNRCYDLEQALSILKERDDIEWVDSYLRPTEPSIKPIPYYNREDDYYDYLEFVWHPTNEDFEKVKNTFTNSDARFNDICKHVFGLKKLSEY